MPQIDFDRERASQRARIETFLERFDDAAAASPDGKD
jgi:hypothetical protein